MKNGRAKSGVTAARILVATCALVAATSCHQGSASSGGGAAGANGGIGAAPVPPSCLQGAYCSKDPGITPCPSGYDCDLTLTPPQCVRLYCLPKGVACSGDAQCVLTAATCDQTHQTTAQCLGPGDVGAPCLGGFPFAAPDCKSGMYCDQNKRCAKFLGLNATCDPTAVPDICNDDLFCDASSGKCAPAGDVGASCASIGCKIELNCGPDLKCAPRGGVGAQCSGSLLCSQELLCEVASQTCVTVPDLGAPCVDGQCKNGLACDPVSQTCVPLPDVGAACAVGRCADGSPCRCKDGLFCDMLVGVCRQALPAGSSCNDFASCQTGFYCSPGMICAPRLGVGAACPPYDPNANVVDPGCADGLTCEVVTDTFDTCQ
jgi:hypothetical protein